VQRCELHGIQRCEFHDIQLSEIDGAGVKFTKLLVVQLAVG
jgi:hypothetical protein